MPAKILTLATVTQIIGCVSLITLTFLSTDGPMVAVFLYTMALTLNSVHFVNQMTTVQIVGGKYAYVIISVISAQTSLFGLALPPIVSLMAPNHTAAEWAHVFYYVVGAVAVTSFICRLDEDTTS
ncbi:hypothetical protein L596_029151 [Steinernema carpocapsae]|uniref:Major facilitator superfamily (MFS) profile domain-containing protein n=1 Tax=Steinernema carpocapsae TaxID=34508 RepID=A0A4U5LTT1_STECR|nr:hypothetical protein L596_029151 [Steinernema carpocapsae]